MVHHRSPRVRQKVHRRPPGKVEQARRQSGVTHRIALRDQARPWMRRCSA
jgi:hypothetical protein